MGVREMLEEENHSYNTKIQHRENKDFSRSKKREAKGGRDEKKNLFASEQTLGREGDGKRGPLILYWLFKKLPNAYSEQIWKSLQVH